ncbi:hypothetical protein BDN70DRAFT_874668 [Pholiota conissans]|uniref:Uncharacterized protein n=1 Tax=Pholiota conissans TaxID=109636 RepID=A0A9P6D4I7_9AGAR|nr:hypothetical protein BDN70DRAFT_874668 [Pholiota conissans]
MASTQVETVTASSMDGHEMLTTLDRLSEKQHAIVKDAGNVSGAIDPTSHPNQPVPDVSTSPPHEIGPSHELHALQTNDVTLSTPEQVSVASKEPTTTSPAPDTTDVAPDSSLSTQSLKELLPNTGPTHHDAILPPNTISPPTSVTPTVEKKSQGVGTPASIMPPNHEVQVQYEPKLSSVATDHPPWDWTSELREREVERRSREIDRRERELERRERELERRQREFEYDKARWTVEIRSAPQWHDALESLRERFDATLLAERKKAAEREAALEATLMRKVNDMLEKDRQMYGAMQMSDKEVNEMMESSVGYLLQSDDDIADRVRFQSLLYLSQERLAMEAGLQPASGSGSLSLAWRIALGPSVITENRFNKALELLKDRELDESTKKVMESKAAMEYVVEFTSHLRKEGSEMGDHSFAPGRISREAYLESVERQARQGAVDYDALLLLVDFIAPK